MTGRIERGAGGGRVAGEPPRGDVLPRARPQLPRPLLAPRPPLIWDPLGTKPILSIAPERLLSLILQALAR